MTHIEYYNRRYDFILPAHVISLANQIGINAIYLFAGLTDGDHVDSFLDMEWAYYIGLDWDAIEAFGLNQCNIPAIWPN